MITHYDLFAGIGGFSLALEETFNNEKIKHIFCEWEEFPTAVLKQHWPNGEYWGNITDLVAHTSSEGWNEGGVAGNKAQRYLDESAVSRSDQNESWSIVTGGFPCQPFSAAGRRKGTDDDRYQWPNMFSVIRNVKPKWVIAENVRGLVTWNEGMVLEQVCSDLESEGYEVQPFIIPAVAVNAPHRRDRVWIVANRSSNRQITEVRHEPRQENIQHSGIGGDASNPESIGNRRSTGEERRASERLVESQELKGSQIRSEGERRIGSDWDSDWREIAFATCLPSMDDGLPRIMDGTTISHAKWRQQSIKAYGNAIVPEVAMHILTAIKVAEELASEQL